MSVASRSPSPPRDPARRGSPDEGEISQLLAFSRELIRVRSVPDAVMALGESLAATLPWRTLVVLAGDELIADTLVQGGEHLDIAGRQSFATALAQVATERGLTFDRLVWPTSPAAERPVAAAVPLVVRVLSRQGGRTGLVAIEPCDDAPLAGEARRLLGGLVQQIALVLDRIEHARVDLESRLATVLDAVPCGVLIIDDTQRLRQVNATGNRLLRSLSGADPEPGSRLTDLRLAVGLLTAQQVVEFSSCIDQRTYELISSPPDAGLRTVILRDVTVDRARQEQAQQTERLTALGEMLSGVAHELNNPLSTVIGYSQLLARRPLEEGVADRLRVVAHEASRCRRIVQNLLDVAHSRPPETVPVNLNDVIEGVLDLFAYRLRVDGIEVEWARAMHLPAVSGDRHRLQQVLVNLLSNAHHALCLRSSPRRIRIVARSVAARALVEVTDNGPGIPTSHLERIFEPFFTTKEAGVGTGLGLPLAARTLREHGGRLSVRSEPGSGATFVLDLPVLQQQASPDADAGRATRERSYCRILVVEDEQNFRQLLEEALTEEGHQVRCAEDGEVGLLLLQDHTFDLVLSDLRMPVLSGRGMYERLLQRGSRLARRFLFMSGDTLGEEMHHFLDQHGLVCLRKPFGLDELDRAIQATLTGVGPGHGPVVDSARGEADETSP